VRVGLVCLLLMVAAEVHAAPLLRAEIILEGEGALYREQIRLSLLVHNDGGQAFVYTETGPAEVRFLFRQADSGEVVSETRYPSGPRHGPSLTYSQPRKVVIKAGSVVKERYHVPGSAPPPPGRYSLVAITTVGDQTLTSEPVSLHIWPAWPAVALAGGSDSRGDLELLFAQQSAAGWQLMQAQQHGVVDGLLFRSPTVIAGEDTLQLAGSRVFRRAAGAWVATVMGDTIDAVRVHGLVTAVVPEQRLPGSRLILLDGGLELADQRAVFVALDEASAEVLLLEVAPDSLQITRQPVPWSEWPQRIESWVFERQGEAQIDLVWEAGGALWRASVLEPDRAPARVHAVAGELLQWSTAAARDGSLVAHLLTRGADGLRYTVLADEGQSADYALAAPGEPVLSWLLTAEALAFDGREDRVVVAQTPAGWLVADAGREAWQPVSSPPLGYPSLVHTDHHGTFLVGFEAGLGFTALHVAGSDVRWSE
jgi:hypothetical protein